MSIVLCSDCNRVLLAEHGPTCPECLEAQGKPKPKSRVAALLEPEKAEPVYVRKGKAKKEDEAEADE